jgi:hypothetical protein
LDAHSLLEINSIWRSVFDCSPTKRSAAEVVEAKRQPGEAKSLGERSVRDDGTRRDHFDAAWPYSMTAKPVAFGGGGGRTSSMRSPSDLSQAQAQVQDGEESATLANSLPSEKLMARGLAARMDAREPVDSSGAEEGAAAETDEPSDGLQSDHEAVGPERVSVFVQNGAVAVTVRDPRLSDVEAVRDAFQTARALTGQGASLKQLLLNGRQLYQRPELPKTSEYVRFFDA